MNKKINNIAEKILLGLAIGSFMIALAEGIIFYNPVEYPDTLIRYMLIAQNTIRAFSFKSDIGIKDVQMLLQESTHNWELILGYIYLFVLFIAPYCTVSYVYKFLKKVFRFGRKRHWKKHDGIIIFGYNNEVKAILDDYHKKARMFKDYRIHLVTEKISEDEEIQLLRHGVSIHKIDCLQLTSSQLDYFFGQMKLSRAKNIVFFEESSVRNFSLFKMFYDEKLTAEAGKDRNENKKTESREEKNKTIGEKTLEYIVKKYKATKRSIRKFFGIKMEIEKLRSDIKFFCRCENEGIHKLLEDFQDSKKTADEEIKNTDDKKSEQDGENKKNAAAETKFDVEIISIPELRVRNTLRIKPLHGYYLSKQNVSVNNWELHLLIVGFGKLGQQMLMQAMNQGVVSSKNNILIDVVDFEIEKKASIFANAFNEDYVKISKNNIKISSNNADGEFQIRFHQMDVRYKEFYNILKKCGQEEGKEDKQFIFTYAAICIEDEEVGIHCLSELQRYLRQHASGEDYNNITIAVRMEMDKYMKEYLNSNTDNFSNVVAFEEDKDVITLDELFHDKLDQEAKEYNRIYHNIKIMTKTEKEEEDKAEEERIKKEKEAEDTKKNQKQSVEEERKSLWKKLELFKRDSNRALTEHSMIKEVVWEKLKEENGEKSELEDWFGKNGSILKDQGNSWTYENETEFVAQQSNSELYPCVSELSRMEHRRWCYFMASRGWSCLEDNEPNEEGEKIGKDPKNKKNICLRTWDNLKDVYPKTCKYDLMWLLKKYSENLEKDYSN